MVKEKKKKKKSKKNKKHHSDSSDSENEEKKKEKLKKVQWPPGLASWLVWPITSVSDGTVICFLVSQALDAEDKRIKQMEAIMQLDERKRPYNSLLEVKAPTEEEMEAFRMKRCRPDDPMASFLGQ